MKFGSILDCHGRHVVVSYVSYSIIHVFSLYNDVIIHFLHRFTLYDVGLLDVGSVGYIKKIL